MASITRRGDAWVITIELEKGSDGKRRRMTRTIRGAKRQAEEEMHRLVAQLSAEPSR